MRCLAELKPKKIVENTVGTRAIEAMEERARIENVTIEKIMKKLCISIQTLTHWKKGGQPCAYFLQQFALNGYDIDYILTGESKQKLNMDVDSALWDTIGGRAGLAIKAYAHRNGTTIRQECKELGVNNTVIQRWQGEYNPSGTALQKMALRGYDIHWILTGEVGNENNP